MTKNKNITVVCKDIKKSFISGDRVIEVLHGIDLTLYEREMVILMGPSGSGKTTLVTIIAGILTQDSGECLVMGKSINSLPIKQKNEFRGKNIGFLFQKLILVPTLNAIENAAIPLLFSRVNKEEAFDKAKNLLISMGLKERMYSNPEQLSGGEQQRVAIARAIIQNPPLIICDEPTSSLDYARGKQIMEILQDIKNKNNSTIIIVTHDQRIVEFADRVINLEDGKVKNQTSNSN